MWRALQRDASASPAYFEILSQTLKRCGTVFLSPRTKKPLRALMSPPGASKLKTGKAPMLHFSSSHPSVKSICEAAALPILLGEEFVEFATFKLGWWNRFTEQIFNFITPYQQFRSYFKNKHLLPKCLPFLIGKCSLPRWRFANKIKQVRKTGRPQESFEVQYRNLTFLFCFLRKLSFRKLWGVRGCLSGFNLVFPFLGTKLCLLADVYRNKFRRPSW